MKNQKFKAFVVRDKNKSGIESMDLDELMPGNVLVKVKYTSLNYKDGLAILNKAPIIKKYPMIPGSDFAGIVINSNHKRFKKGDKVVCNGWGIGEKHYGGFSEYARVKGDWLIHIPKKFTLKDSMIIGAAGYTASLCVLELIKYVAPNKGKILVTGSSGGVGSIAVNLLSKLDYHVVALSSKDTNFLLKIGANEVLKRENFKITDKPLLKEIWAGSIDTVGGDILSTILSQTKYNGVVVNTGLAKSYELKTTVYPFILRNIMLSGIDCVYASYRRRLTAWKFLSKHIDNKFLTKIVNYSDINDLVSLSKMILDGKIKGRVVIKI